MHHHMSAALMRTYEPPASERRQHLATAIRLSGEAILVIDIDGTIRDVNDAALAFFGRQSPGELTGKNIVDLLSPEDRAGTLANIQKRLAGELIENQEFEFELATGERRWGELNPTILNNVDGQAMGSIVVLRDITTRRHSEAQLRPDLDAKGKHYLTVITDAVKQMGVQIDALLTLVRTRHKAIQRTRIASGQLVREVIQERACKAASRDILWNIGSLPNVQGDPAVLRLVLTHLIDNAIKYTRSRASARITIRCATLTAREVVCFVRANDIYWRC